MISLKTVKALIITCGLLLKFFNNCRAVEVGLPLIQISHDDDLDDDYPELREEVHLEDFFWTGSGDGPPDYLKKVHTGISKGKDVVVKTETVIATVYVDGNNEVDIPICLDCYGEGTIGIDGTWTGVNVQSFNYSNTDRRYWLLTVMSGFYTEKDNPILEEKLAKLYRLSFTRQQTRHLGINGAQHISGISVSLQGRDRRHNEVTTTLEPSDYDDSEFIDINLNDGKFYRKSDAPYPVNINSELYSSSEESLDDTTVLDDLPATPTSTETVDILAQVVTEASWELIQQKDNSQKFLESHAMPVLQKAQKLTNLNFRDDQVRVVMHNITQLTVDDVEQRVAYTAMSGALYDEDINERIDMRPAANQTELIYSVFVNGRPVLAITAANDMKLVSESEVSTVMGKETFMKAEPYLREPQATPLAPATHSGTIGFIDSIQNNPLLVIVSSIAILLLLLLLIALLLMGRSHVRHKQQEVNRTSSRNELLSETQSVRPTSTISGLDTGETTTQSREVGIQNFSYENEQNHNSREARIHFPEPPAQRIRKSSITSSDNTSDSSVYCPINPPTADVQRMLDDKAANLFERHKTRRQNQYDRAEGYEDAVYMTVASEKKRKPKRRYLSENRVGSLETSPVQSQRDCSGDEADVAAKRQSYAHFERTNKTYNPHNNYHRNKLLHQKTIHDDRVCDDDDDDDDDVQVSSEAINKNIIRILQPTEKSSDSGSIGSFLSMQSVKAFPKTALPVPLNRVLEPVFVTYYDDLEHVHQSVGKDMKQRNKKRSSRDTLDENTIATIENFPTPKAPKKFPRFASQSDNPDPGVVGPIVWERHKKRLSADDILDNEKEDNDVYKHKKTRDFFSPSRDPADMRIHYEDLLEGALQMYSSQDDLPMPLPSKNFTNQRKPTNRELRGSSAGASNCNLKSSILDIRPSTAQPDTVTKLSHPTLPPSPNLGAWGSGGGSMHGSHSPLVRPMSAGPFHRPADLPSNTRPAQDLSTAPLIEAIQKELHKFQNHPK